MGAWKAGRVLWFDPISGEGLVVDDSGISYYVHHSAISTKSNTQNDSKKTFLKEDSKVEFTIYTNSFSTQVEKVRKV